MQKRIKFEQILIEKHKNYAEIWRNLLQQINQYSPIFNLESFGAIACIDKCLYLLIEPSIMNNHIEVEPMINLQQYFLKPECYRLNFRSLSKMERQLVEYFVSYIKKALNTNQLIYLLVIDLRKLGKLIISKNNIEYFNGNHHWKYSVNKASVQLPTLFHFNNENSNNQQKMAKKFSLSVKKYESLSVKKDQLKSKPQIRMKRSNSMIKLNTTFKKNLSNQQKMILDNNRVATESYQNKARSKSKAQLQKLQKLRVFNRQKLQLKAQVIKNIKTQPCKQDDSKLSRQSSRKLMCRQKSPTGSKSRRNFIQTQSNERKVKMQNKPEKQKLSIGQMPRLRIPSQRRMLTQQKSYHQIHQSIIMEFVCRSSSVVIEENLFKNVPQYKINQFLSEITNIYLQSQQLIKKNRQKKKKLLQQQKKIIRLGQSSRQINYNRFQISISTTEDNQRTFVYCFNLIKRWQNQFKTQLESYIVDQSQHFKLISNLIKWLKNDVQIRNLSHRTCIKISIMLHDLYHFIQNAQIQLLNNIIKKKKKLIVINFLKESSFKQDIMNFVQNFQNLYKPLTDYLMLCFPKILWIQAHETEDLKNAKNSLHNYMIGFQSLVLQNFTKFRTANCKSILSATYHTQKQGLILIKKLEGLKYNVENEIQFKSQIIFQGVYMKFSLIKDYYLKIIHQKQYEIYSYFLKVYEKSQNQLNNKLKTIIVINVDYLSDYKCRQYRQEIQQNYKNLLESLMLLINHFYYLLRESQIYHLLNIAYQFKAQIQHNLDNFYNKLQQYRSNSNKTIKMLEIQNKKDKQIYQDLTQRLKKLLVNLVNQRSILQVKKEILKLDNDFEAYSINNQKLIRSMKENQMVYWEDDQFFSTNMNLLKSSLEFLQGKHFKILFNTLIGELTINEFYNAFQQYSNFINLLVDSKLEKMFKSTFTLIQNNLVLAEVVLYKQFTQFQLQKSKEMGFDIVAQKSSKIFTTIKRYQNYQKKNFQKIVQLYRNSRLNQFNLYNDEQYICIKLWKNRGQFDLEYISNIDAARQYFQSRNNMQSAISLQKIEQFSKIYKQILLFNKMIYHISYTALPQSLKKQLLQELNSQYEKLLHLNIEITKIQKFKYKLIGQKMKYMQIFYHQKVSTFARFALCSIEQLVNFQQWKNNECIARNIRYIYQHVDNVIFDLEGNILAYVIAKDMLTFDKPFNIFEKEGGIAKTILIHAQNFLRNSVSHSEFACIHIKILIWQIYFTQQVELCFMTQSPLSKVKDYFLQIINQITNQIRYDMKLHHKSYEIAQLNFFINHIQKIKDIHSISDFQWVSTIRYYQKLKVVKVQQNQQVHDYSFQIKKALPYDPSFQLETNISYGFKESNQYYEISSYVLGKPFATFQTLKDYCFQVNYSVFMNIVKKYQYFVRIIVSPQNFKSINYFHKKILQFSLKKNDDLDQQTLSFPIFFQYESQSALPLCFTEKYRNFSNPEFSFNLNLIILLQLNKYQHIIQKSQLNTQILIKVLNMINVKKNLTMKKAIGFVQQLCKFLQQTSQKSQIYKFCYKYFIVNYQIDDQELSIMLKQLTIQTEKDLKALTKQKIDFISNFIEKKKKDLIIYGPSSHKTYCIKSLKIPSFYEYHQINKSNVYFIEGIQEFLSCKKQLDKNSNIKLIVEDRFIHHIEPSMIVNAILHYTNKLSVSNVQSIFKQNIKQLKLEGNSERLWNKLISFCNIFAQIVGQTSLIGVTELILRCYKRHIQQFLDQLSAEERQYYKLTINKDTIRTFLVITHEILYYMLSTEQRKKFSEKIRLLPFMEQHRSEQLQSLTCKGLNCEKILNLMKKQKVTFKNIGNYTKQFIIIKKYMKYQQPIAIYSTNKITSKLLQNQIQNIDHKKIKITLQENYIYILRMSKYKNILYIINDLHMQDKPRLTFLKSHQQRLNKSQSYYLMLTCNHEYKKIMKHCIGFKFPDIQIEQIYKFQTKQGIIEQTQVNCRNIWKNGYFTDQSSFLMFLINISVKLPSQYYKKYFARQLIYSKFTTNVLALDTIYQNQQFISKVVDIPKTNAYLIDFKGHHQEITETQINKKIQKIIGNLSFVQKMIVNKYYKQIIYYVLADKIYIIKQQMTIFPFIITNLHERKHFILKNLDFTLQLVEVIEQIYKSDKQCTLIVQQPLASSKNWQQFFFNYLKGVDLINLYNEIREYTQLLTKKEEYVYRLQNQAIPLKDKVNQILYSKIKIIICQNIKSTLAINQDELYINNIIYLNCSLTTEHKKIIVQSIIKKMMTQQNEEVREVVTKFKPYVLQLIEKNLLFLNRIELFLNDIVTIFKLELQELVKFKEAMLHKRKLFYNLELIREQINRQNTETLKKQKQNKQYLGKILETVNNFEKYPIDYSQNQYYQQLIQIRDNFTSNQDKFCIWIKERPEYQQIYKQLSNLLKQSLRIEYDVPILELNTQDFIKILDDKQCRKQIEQINQRFSNNQESNRFILLKYIKFIQKLTSLYKALQNSQKLIENQVKLLNYFYLLDICIELKAKQAQIMRQFDDLMHRKKLIDEFIQILISVEHINLQESDLINYHIFNRVKKIIRNYAIQSHDYHLMKILKSYDNRFLSISQNFQEYLLKQSQYCFQQSNKAMLLEKLKLIVYDPHNKIEKMCHQLSIKIIYVDSEEDVEELYDYKFKMTIFCIKLKSLEQYYKNRKLIDNCIDVITKKHTDLKEYKLEKLVISIDEREIISQIQQQFSVLNLQYNFIKFVDEIQKRMLFDEYKWNQKKQSYILAKKKLRTEIQLIKTLNPEQISLYIIKLQTVINSFQIKHKQISQISSRKMLQQSHYFIIQQIFKIIIRIHQKAQFPINLSLRLLKNINIQDLLLKWQTNSLSNCRQQQDWFKNMLLHNRSNNILQEIQECITQSRFIVIVYEHFNKKIMKEILQIEEGMRYAIRTIIQINDEELKQFANSSSFSPETNETKEIILILVKFHQIYKLRIIINKCAVLWL